MSNSTPRAALPPLPDFEQVIYEKTRRFIPEDALQAIAEQVEQIRRETVQACAAKVSAEDDPDPGYDEWDRGYSAGIKFAVSAILYLLKEPKE